MNIGKNNIISETTLIPDFVEMGDFNRIGSNVTIQVVKGAKKPKLVIGDCNIINDNVKILVGDEGIFIKDWNVIHNNIFMIGERKIEIGHNGWFGQHTILDGSGGLSIGNGVRIGMYSQIWTHVASGEQLEGCVLYAQRGTIIHDDVWLVGSCIVGSGIVLAKRTICLINSLLTKDTIEGKVYSGSPAKIMEKVNFYKKVDIVEKYEMMYNWAIEFANSSQDITVERPTAERIIIINKSSEKIVFSSVDHTDIDLDPLVTVFNMQTKTFKKKKSILEREFYTFLYNNKARFIPIN